MNAATELEALAVTRHRTEVAERLQPWRYDDLNDEGVRRRFAAFINSLGRTIEKHDPTQPSDLL